MENKQIIINNVDVSRCDFLAKEDDYCSYSGEYRAYKGQCGCSDEEMCKDHPNCFYKKSLNQLKCKEQECEELKEDIERWKSNFNGKVSAIEELLQQLDQLKAENEQWQKELDKTHLLMLQRQDELIKAEQKLERIREFAKTFEQEDETRIIILKIIDEVK